MPPRLDQTSWQRSLLLSFLESGSDQVIGIVEQMKETYAAELCGVGLADSGMNRITE